MRLLIDHFGSAVDLMHFIKFIFKHILKVDVETAK